ncbi:cytochrome c2 [Arthrobacter sp. V4I6]|nr:cytochrome c2 [Arthrobacter sp. V4I6]
MQEECRQEHCLRTSIHEGRSILPELAGIVGRQAAPVNTTKDGS